MDAVSNDVATKDLGNLVAELVHALATDPEQVLVLARRDEGCVLINVSATEAQMGRIIGKQGATARSLRRILHTVSNKYAVRCELNIGPFADAGKAGN